ILAVCSSSCIGSKTWSPYDMIMISLSSSRIISQSLCILHFVMTIFLEFYYMKNMFVLSKIIFMFLNFCGLWFGAWLSVFYCIKVASFTQSFFIWLKQRIPRLMPWMLLTSWLWLMPWMLLTSWLWSFVTAIPFAWDDNDMHDNFTAPLLVTNSSAMRNTRKNSLTFLFYFCNACTALPLILSVVSSVLLIWSLCVHTRQMQNNASGFRDPSLEAHMKAIKSVCSFLILYSIYFICLLPFLFSAVSPLSDGESVCVAVIAACPAGHTMVLIWSNPKFQELPARIWHHTTCPVR
ncbi:T2R40 protein, partial [Grantiella picta]|nr:T2R40 protein [Grantiella picta]